MSKLWLSHMKYWYDVTHSVSIALSKRSEKRESNERCLHPSAGLCLSSCFPCKCQSSRQFRSCKLGLQCTVSSGAQPASCFRQTVLRGCSMRDLSSPFTSFRKPFSIIQCLAPWWKDPNWIQFATCNLLCWLFPIPIWYSMVQRNCPTHGFLSILYTVDPRFKQSRFKGYPPFKQQRTMTNYQFT